MTDPSTNAAAYRTPREQLAYLTGWQDGAESAEAATNGAATLRHERYKAEARHGSITAALAVTMGGTR